MLYHCAIRRTETLVPAMQGRPPRTPARFSIKLPICVTVDIRFNYRRSGAESLGGTGFRLRGFLLAILGGCGGFELREKAGGDAADFVDCV